MSDYANGPQLAVAPKSESTAGTSVLSVEQLNRQIKGLLEGELPLVWVQGELSNFKAHTSGHFYFSLKDAKSQIRAVMFRGFNSRLKFRPNDGLEVIIRGRVTVYEPRGEYQITVEMMEPVGAGALQKAFEQLKLKLKDEGLFEASRKRKIPNFPKHIALVTSPTGAAIRDMINVLSRRNRGVAITLVPTIVQGEAAAPKIVEALNTAIRIPNVDVIIIGRGGGSMEDLWAFNDETLARAIVASHVPIISAVGHEIDFTISDFVADLRAPTPSAAAELVVKSSDDIIKNLKLWDRLLLVAVQKQIRNLQHRLRQTSGRMVDPKRHLQDLAQRNDELILRLQRASLNHFENLKMRLKLVASKVQSSAERDFLRRQHRLQTAMGRLDSLSPLNVVQRGYSITTLNKQLVKSFKQVKNGDEIEIALMEGVILAQVKESRK